MTSKKSKTLRATLASQLIAGAKKHLLPGGPPLQVGGASYTVDDLTKKLQSIVDMRAEVNAAKSAAKAKVEEEDAAEPADGSFFDALESVIRGMFPSVDVLADFGLAPRKRSSLTVEKKAAAVAKAAATRKARHTMGPNQKKVVKGGVTGVVVTPVMAPTPTPTPPPGPAPSPAPAPNPAPAPAPSVNPAH
jgi:hypothetical protein